MPNWCECDLRVFGSLEDRIKFIEFAKGVDDGDSIIIDLNKFIPMPDELKDTTSPNKTNPQELIDRYGYKDWYDWSIANWGTKWNTCGSAINDDNKIRTFFYFSTAWSPPIPVIYKMSEMFPNLKFDLRYYEQGVGYCGQLVVEKGRTITDSYTDNYRGGRGG